MSGDDERERLRLRLVRAQEALNDLLAVMLEHQHDLPDPVREAAIVAARSHRTRPPTTDEYLQMFYQRFEM